MMHIAGIVHSVQVSAICGATLGRVVPVGDRPAPDEPPPQVELPDIRDVQVVQDGAVALYALPDEALEDAIASCQVCSGIGYLRRDARPGEPGFGTLDLCPRCGPVSREQRRRLRLARLTPIIERYSTLRGELLLRRFSNYNTRDGSRTAYNAVVRWVRGAAGEDEGPTWLYLWGPVGGGKTHLAAAAANYLVERRVPVVMTTFPALLGMIRGLGDFSAKEEMLVHLSEMPVLVLDDVGAENRTAWTEENLFRIVDTRYNLRLPTLIAANCAPDGLGDQRVASRIQDRALGLVVPVKAPDRRLRKEKQ